MSFSTLARNKNTERLIALLSAVAVLMSLMAIVVYRHVPRARVRPLPPYPQPEQRPT